MRLTLQRTTRTHQIPRIPLTRIRGGGTTLTLRTYAGFLAKNDRPDKLPSPIRLPSMFQLVGRQEPERFWCPVRAIDIYLYRTQGPEYSQEDSRLLRHPKPKITTTKGHVAYWIRRAVSLAYDSAYNGASLQDVLDGAGWHGEESFFRHYIRDMTAALAGPAGKAPVVIAGRVRKN